MKDDATRNLAAALFVPPTPPINGLYEMQKEMLRLQMNASAAFASRAMEAMQTGPAGVFPTAPVQMMGFLNDCMRLSFSPMTLMANTALSPLASMMGAFVPPRVEVRKGQDQ